MASGKNGQMQDFFRGAPYCDDIATSTSHDGRFDEISPIFLPSFRNFLLFVRVYPEGYVCVR
jgi:hypothetical protein